MTHLWPGITDRELGTRMRQFIMTSERDEFLRLHRAAFKILGPPLLSDDMIRPIIDTLEGRRIGFAIRGFFKATLTIDEQAFTIDSGIEDDVPIFWCASRRDYADAMLGSHDTSIMVLERRLGATRKSTLLKWWRPNADILTSDEVESRLSSLFPKVEKEIARQLTAMGY